MLVEPYNNVHGGINGRCQTCVARLWRHRTMWPRISEIHKGKYVGVIRKGAFSTMFPTSTNTMTSTEQNNLVAFGTL